jgi:hypothetical protein
MKPTKETPMQPKPSAQATYSERYQRAHALLEQISAALVAHDDAQAADTRNWGYAGDLGLAVERLGLALGAVAACDVFTPESDWVSTLPVEQRECSTCHRELDDHSAVLLPAKA